MMTATTGNIAPLLPVILLVIIFVGGVGLIVRSAFKMIQRERKGNPETVRRDTAEARRDYP